MLENFLNCRSIFSTDSKYLFNEINLQGIEPLGELDGFFHFGDNLFTSLASKRSNALDHFKEENSHSPDINFITVMFLFNHFWCHILECAAHCCPGLKDGCKSKITKFSNIIFSDEYIFRLYYFNDYFNISMHVIMCMQVLDGLADISEVFADELLGQLS